MLVPAPAAFVRDELKVGELGTPRELEILELIAQALDREVYLSAAGFNDLATQLGA